MIRNELMNVVRTASGESGDLHASGEGTIFNKIALMKIHQRQIICVGPVGD